VSTSLDATVVLADGAQVAEGKLYVLGGGWTRLRANAPAPVSLGIIIHVPWDSTNHQITLNVDLLDDDGEKVLVEGNEVAAAGQFEVGRPPGMKPGEPLNFPMALNFNGLALDEGGYVWECKLQGEVVARCPFRVIS
jgi:hypothetical protein